MPLFFNFNIWFGGTLVYTLNTLVESFKLLRDLMCVMWREKNWRLHAIRMQSLKIFIRNSHNIKLNDNTRDVALPRRSMGCRILNPPARPLLFYRVFCCIIWVVWVDFCFCLHSCDMKFSAFDHFRCILECCVSSLCSNQ